MSEIDQVPHQHADSCDYGYDYHDYDREEYLIEAIDKMHHIQEKNEIHCTAQINNQLVDFKIDTGAKLNVMALELFDRISCSKDINSAKSVQIVAYGGDTFCTLGTANLECKFDSTSPVLEFHIVDRSAATLIGLKDALNLQLIRLHHEVHQVEATDEFTKMVIKDYSDLFDDSLGELPVTYRMKLDPRITPAIRPPRKIPVSMEQSVKTELDRMVQSGVIVPEDEPTEWVSQMVATKKKNGDIRICLDPRDLNKALMRPHHPMRTVEDVASRMANATVFSTLDAKSAFWQIKLDHKSSVLTTFNSPFGRFRFQRMPYGISPASEVQQRTMEQLFAGYPCFIIVDDLLIFGSDVKQHDENLKKVLQRARAVNLKLNVKKCRFRLNKVSYIGHEFTQNGLRPDQSKCAAIKDMPAPDSQAALQRYLGMINYLHKFIPNISEKTAPLRELLHKGTSWCWQAPQQKAFEQLQSDNCSPPVLKFFDPAKPVVLSVDASKAGLGAACLQEGLPVAYASRAMTDAETRYAQIEKELLAAVFAATKFHDFIYGRSAVIETDHKPLITIVKKALHAAPARLQRMLLQLQQYNLEFVYKCGAELYLADTLSRAYIKETPGEECDMDCEILSVSSISPGRMKELQSASLTDPLIQQLSCVIKDGWPEKFRNVRPGLRDFFPIRDELAIEDGIVVKGYRVVVPYKLQDFYIDQLHKGHPGVEATKRRAREVAFWPTMCDDIEKTLSHCSPCNSLKPHQQKEPLKSHPIPDLPWSTVAADLFEWNNTQYLVAVDSYSGWFEMDPLKDTTSRTIIQKLKYHFAAHGVPAKLISDNASYFVSREFQSFSNEWNFVHVTSSPNFPQSNGLAENGVKQAKRLLEKSKKDSSDVYMGLLNLRNIPKESLPSPAQRLLGRRTRTPLHVSKALLKPVVVSTQQVSRQLRKCRLTQKRYYDKTARPLKPLKINQTVRMQTDKGHDRLAVVKNSLNMPRSYTVVADGREYRRNRRHLLPVNEPSPIVGQEPANTGLDSRIQEPAAQAVMPQPDATASNLPQTGDTKEIISPSRVPVGDKPSPSMESPHSPVITRCGRTSHPNKMYIGSQWSK